MIRSVVTPEIVCDAIATAQRRQRGAATPNEGEVAELTRWINVYLTNPWDSEELKAYHDGWRGYENERKVLRDALEILKADLAAHDRCTPVTGWEREYERNGERLRTAVEVVAERGETALYNPPGFIPRPTGSTPKPWSVMARVLARETLVAVRSAQARMGRTPQRSIGDRDGVVVRTVQFWLKQMTGTKQSRDTIYEAVASVGADADASTGGI